MPTPPCLRPARLGLAASALAFGLASPVGAQVADSVRMDVKVYSFAYTEPGPGTSTYFNCGSGVYATWPDVLADVLERETQYREYTRVATDGEPFPPGLGQTFSHERLGITVPDGHYGFWLSGGGAQAAGKWPDCGAHRTAAEQMVSGAPFVLGGRTYRYTAWYATYDLPDGTPIALFEWEQGAGLGVDFDASFESEQSREVDVTAPDNKRPVASYAWDFGDGTTGSGAKPRHTYTRADTFTVTLTVTDDDGETARRKEEVIVRGSTLTVRVETLETPVDVGDEIALVATITNTGTLDIENVEAYRAFSHVVSFPDSLEGAGVLRMNPAFTVREVTPDPITEEILEPGDSMEVYGWYEVDRAGAFRRSTGDPFEAVATTIRSVLLHVQGTDEDGNAPRVVDACEAGGCSDVTSIEPKSVELAVKTFTTPETTPIETSAVTSGLVIGPDPRFPVVNGRPTREVAHFARIDGVGRCRAGCIDFEVVATDPDSGDPVPGLNLDLSYPTAPGAGVVTPGGLLCDRGQDTCGASITLTTDGFGKVEGYAGVPGVIKDVPVTLTVKVSATQAPTHENATGIERHAITIRPNVLYDDPIPINAQQADDLAAAAATRLGFRRADLPSRLCASVKKAFSSARKYAFVYGERVPVEFIDTICKNVDDLTLTGLLSAAQSSAQIPQMAWFFESTQLPSVGLAETRFSPMPAVSSQFVDELSAALESRLDNQGDMAAGAAPFSLYEVSYLEMDPGFFPIKTRALYLRMWSHTALVKANYEAGTWLLERHDRGVLPTLAGPASSGDTSVSTGPSTSTVSEAPSEPVASSSIPTSALRRGAARQPVAADSLVATPDSLYADAIVVLSPGDPGRVESVRVLSATGDLAAGQAAELASPLLYDHPAGAPVRVLARGEAVPPEPYAVAPVDTVETDGRARLVWATIQPVAEVDVQVARDAAFTDILYSETLVGVEIADGAYDVDMAAAGMTMNTPYFWRSRLRDRSGESAWSEGSRFVVSSVTTSEDADGPTPSALELTLYPNPARDRVTVVVEVPAPSHQRVALYDALGRQVAVLIDGERPSGRHELAIRVAGLPAGAYVVRMQANGAVRTRHLTVVR